MGDGGYYVYLAGLLVPSGVRRPLSEWKGVVGLRATYRVLVTWFIWMERNARIFDGKGTPVEKIKEGALALMFWWVSHLPLFMDIPFHLWVFE